MTTAWYSVRTAADKVDELVATRRVVRTSAKSLVCALNLFYVELEGTIVVAESPRCVGA